MPKYQKEKSYKDPMSMKEHWQIDVCDSVFQKGDPKVMGQEMLAAKAKERPQPHKKINECDH